MYSSSNPYLFAKTAWLCITNGWAWHLKARSQWYFSESGYSAYDERWTHRLDLST
ncbi:MAG: hypothetical protein KME23_02120 [Goleter apudmare HA4340-LM2]|nr:hypothetical protein [Goleter apudmare HA4340-LM2]